MSDNPCMERRCWIVGLFGLAAVVLVPVQAFAWPGTVVFPGVTYEHRSGLQDYGSGPYAQEIYITYIDKNHPSVSFIASNPAQRGMVVSKFASTVGAQVAINTNFYGGGFQPCGMAMGDGVLFTDAYQGSVQGSCSHSIAVGPGNDVGFHDTWGIPNGPAPAGAREVSTGMPTLVRDGVVVAQAELESSAYPDHMATAQPRTAMCLHEDGGTLILAVVDGREAGVRVGMRGITLANFMKSLGCYRAINLDGGGSSTMFVEGQTPYPGRPTGVVNRTSDGQERGVCCHFGVRIDPNPPVPDAGPDAAPDVQVDAEVLDVSSEAAWDGALDAALDAVELPDGGGSDAIGLDGALADGSGLPEGGAGASGWTQSGDASGCACGVRGKTSNVAGLFAWVLGVALAGRRRKTILSCVYTDQNQPNWREPPPAAPRTSVSDRSFLSTPETKR
jgi:hypothetical protein